MAFWLLVWQIFADIVDNKFLLPGIKATINSLFELLFESDFYYAILLSASRVIVGLALGIVTGCILALLCSKFEFIKALFLPIVRIIRSTPVASFIIVLWVLMSGDMLSIFIAFLMVMPIIYQNVLDGISSIDKQLIEVADVFEFSYAKRLKLLTLPAIEKYLIPGIITATGLAWKAEIAAEIIAYTTHSIGQGIHDAKYNLDTPRVFAWTVVIILLSIGLEILTRTLIRRVEK